MKALSAKNQSQKNYHNFLIMIILKVNVHLIKVTVL